MNYSFLLGLLVLAVILGVPVLLAARAEGKRKRKTAPKGGG